MKNKILLFSLTILILSSCSTAYKSTQTPDDVYYSPATGADDKETVKSNKQNDRYENYLSSTDDNYLRMKVRNYSLWSGIDDYAYWYDSRYDFSYYNLWNPGYFYGYNYNYYNGYIFYPYYLGGWGGYYMPNPVIYVIGYKNPKTTVATSGGSGSYLTTYKNNTYNNSNYNLKTNPYRREGFGSLIKQVFSSSNNNNSSASNNTSWDRPARTFTPSTNSSVPATSSSAGGNSGGYGSKGSSSGAPRTTRQ
ncbi:MAG: hypothetical protein JSR09_09510 [Bacteroidetes bacterium]|nr:hypothetical protein [Bacteroidota bacterium]MBS1649926.1 hypothetical protein [Bacteroidota bacterium]